MIDAYKIGTTYVLTDLVTPKLLEMSRQFVKLEEQSAKLKLSFKELGGANGGLRVAATAAKSLDTNLMRAQMQAANLGNRLGKIGAGDFNAASSSANALTTAMSSATKQAAALRAELSAIQRSTSSRTVMPGGGGRGGGRHGGFHGGNVHMDDDGIGMSGVGFGLGGLLGGPGMAALAVGYGAYGVTKASLQEASKYQMEQARFKMYGMDDSINAQAKAFAENTDMAGLSMIDKMHFMTEAQGVFRESTQKTPEEALRGAMIAAPIMAKLSRASKLSGVEFTDAQQMDALRFIEQRGGLRSTADFEREANLAYRMSISSGGNVDYSQLRQFMRTSRSLGLRISDDAMEYMEPILGELKGGPSGQAMATGWNRMLNITRPTNQAAHDLIKYGLWDGSKVIFNKMGGISRQLGDPSKYGEEFTSNPFKAYVDHILPLYERDHLSQTERSRLNAEFFGSTGGAAMDKFEKQWPTIQAGLGAVGKAGDINKGNEVLDKTLEGQMLRFEGAWSDFKNIYGTAVLPSATKIVEYGTEWIKAMNDGAMKKTPFGAPFALLDWAREKLSGSGAPNLAAYPAASPTTVNVTVQIDGKDVAKHVTTTVLKPARSGGALGSGLFNPAVTIPSTINGFS